MNGWADMERKKQEMLKGQGKHEALLLECRLREHRHPFRDSLEMKYMEREKKKIQAELMKIRHTIRHERRNSRHLSMSTRQLTLEAIAPRKCYSVNKIIYPTHLETDGEKSSDVTYTETCVSLDPTLLVKTDTSTAKEAIAVEKSEEDAKSVSLAIKEEKETTHESDVLIPTENVGTIVDITDAIEAIIQDSNHVETETVNRIPKTNLKIDSKVYQPISKPRRQLTSLQGRQFTFVNRSNTYIQKRKEITPASDILSCANYKAMREGIANETLKKLGLK